MSSAESPKQLCGEARRRWPRLNCPSTFSSAVLSISDNGAEMLGLEILVAADIIRTVALAPTLQNVLILGLLVVIRTFLSWGLVVEIEERWPWQSPRVERAARVELNSKE